MSSWSGSSAPPGRQHAVRRQSTPAPVRPAVLRGVLSWPQPLTASAPEGTSATRQTRRADPRVRAPGSRPSPPADRVTVRRLRPAQATTRQWPRTGSACGPATRCRNAGSPRCSGAHPAAGREPELPRHDRNRRSQTRRVSRLRLTRVRRRSGCPSWRRSRWRWHGRERPRPAGAGRGRGGRGVAVVVSLSRWRFPRRWRCGRISRRRWSCSRCRRRGARWPRGG